MAEAQPTETGEPVNTTVVAVPVPDVYLYEPNLQTTHLINGTEYARGRFSDTPVTSLCGGVEVPVADDEDTLPPGLRHFADTLTPDDILADPEGVMDLTVLDDICQRCRSSYGRDGVPSGFNIVRFEMDGSGWSR